MPKILFHISDFANIKSADVNIKGLALYALFQIPSINAYQFVSGSDGTIVEPLTDYSVAPYGFKFLQFDAATCRLYDEAVAIVEACQLYD